MADTDLTHNSARELAHLIKAGKVSPVEVLDAHLAAIERINPKLNAIVTLAAEQAHTAAHAAEAAVARHDSIGSLHGLPIGIKDVTLTAGIRTTFGSPLFKDHVPAEDAEVVRRLKVAGAIVLAKTNTPEFATGANTDNELFGATRNPWNPELSPAGSSGGSAVAVATGMLPLAQGTDFGCSIRIPAAFCGIVGIRPDAGPHAELSDATGVGSRPGSWSPRPHGGRRSHDARCHGRVQPVIADLGCAALDQRTRRRGPRYRLKGSRVVYASDIAGIGVDSEIDSICRKAADGLRDMGATVEPISFDVSDGRDPYQTWRGAWMVGQQFHRMSMLAQFGPNLKGNIEAGLKLTALDIAKAEQTRQQVFHRFRELFERYDVLMTPAAPVRPYPVALNFPHEINGRTFENYVDWIAPAFLITLVSLPAGSVPAGKTKDGLPVGLQIVAPRFEEPRILTVAKFIQQQNPIGRPPVI